MITAAPPTSEVPPSLSVPPHLGGGGQPAFPPEGGEGPSGYCSEAPSEAGDESGTGDAGREGVFPSQHALDLLAKSSPDLVATS